MLSNSAISSNTCVRLCDLASRDVVDGSVSHSDVNFLRTFCEEVCPKHKTRDNLSPLRSPLFLALWISPLCLLTSVALVKKTFHKQNLLQTSIALGNTKPKVLLDAEAVVWRSVFHLARGLSTPGLAMRDIAKEISWQAIEDLSLDDRFRSWFIVGQLNNFIHDCCFLSHITIRRGGYERISTIEDKEELPSDPSGAHTAPAVQTPDSSIEGSSTTRQSSRTSVVHGSLAGAHGESNAGPTKSSRKRKRSKKVTTSSALVEGISEDEGGLNNPIDVDAFLARREPVGSKDYVRWYACIEFAADRIVQVVKIEDAMLDINEVPERLSCDRPFAAFDSQGSPHSFMPSFHV